MDIYITRRVAISHSMNARQTYGRDRNVLSRTEKGQVCITQGHTQTYVLVVCGTGHLSLSTAEQGAYTQT